MIKVVVDSSVFIAALARKYRYHEILRKLRARVFTLAASTEMMLEYVEATEQMYGVQASQIMDGLMMLPNVEHQVVHYKWKLIVVDPDDNKFVDCAIAADADYIVTNDRHFNVLKTVDWPSIEVIDADRFLEILQNS